MWISLDPKNARRRSGRKTAVPMLGVLLLFSAWAGAEPADLKALTREAPLVFAGTVQKVRASNLKVVTPREETAVVRIERVLRAPLTLGDFAGREVTVFLAAGAPVAPGQSLTFFTRIGLYGETLGVVELGRSLEDPGKLQARLVATERELAEDDVAERLSRAAAAVEGQVVAVRPAAAEKELPEIESEHDPEWWEAEVAVASTLKGTMANRVTFYFANSRDVEWAASPKPRVGERGVFLLHRDQFPGVAGWTALRAQDVLSRDEAAIAKRMVKP